MVEQNLRPDVVVFDCDGVLVDAVSSWRTLHDAFVTFVDSVQKEQISETETRSISTFNTGDTIFVRTHAPDGTPLVDVDIQLSYAPLNGKGSVLKKYGDLSYDKRA